MAHSEVYGFCKNKCKVRVSPRPVIKMTSLPLTGWTGVTGAAYKFIQTITVNGIDSDISKQIIAWSPATANAVESYACGIACLSQNTNSLTFICDKKPSGNIDIAVSIQGDLAIAGTLDVDYDEQTGELNITYST